MPDQPLGDRSLSRRGLLTAGLASGSLLVIPASAYAQEAADERAEAAADEIPYHGVDPATESDLTAEQLEAIYNAPTTLAMISRNHLNGTPLFYEPTRTRTSFTFNDTFYDRLSRWRNNVHNYIPSSWGRPARILSYGAYVNKPGMHGQGRGFDIAAVSFTNADGGLSRRFNCRYDQWRSGSNVAAVRRRYWALSASLHWRFRHVLTYLYNREHWNHIHVDNAIYGRYQDALFNTGSTTQVQHVQACCRYIWGLGTTIDGIWGPQTRNHSTEVIRRYGTSSGNITSNSLNWRHFNRASVLKGSGRQPNL